MIKIFIFNFQRILQRVIFWGTALVTGLFYQTSLASECSVNNVGPKSFQFQDGRRTIEVLGWDHWAHDTFHHLNIAFNKISEEFNKEGSCLNLAALAQQILEREAVYAASSHELYIRL